MAVAVAAYVFTSGPSAGQCPEADGRREDISAVAKGLNQLLLEPGESGLQKLLNWLGVKDKHPLPDGQLVQHSLQGYDNLMQKGGLQ
nr:hypothetical protein [Serratia ureilytica]